MIGTIHITGQIGVDVTLLDVIKQVKNQPNATEFLVRLDSVGGFVNVGDDIYSYLKNLSQPITVFATKAYSIASKILMAGDVRILQEGSIDVVMIHLPWMEVQGSHDLITSHLKALKATEDSLVKFYSETLQIDQNTIQSLLTNNTFLSAEQALELGFATQLQAPQLAVARYNNIEEKNESLMNKLSKKLDAIYNKVMGIKNELILQDATGLELIFPDLADGDMPEVDGKATVDGKPAEGEFLMPDGSKIIAVNGNITEIQSIPEEEVAPEEEVLDAETPEETETVDEKDAIIAELQAKIAELEAKLAKSADAEVETQDKVLAILAKQVEKADEMEVKYQALAKQIGSDFNPNTTKENQPNIKGNADTPTSRAWQILNS